MSGPARLLRWWLVLVPVGGCAARPARLPSIQPAQAGFSVERLDAIRGLIQEHVDHKRIAGGVALIARGGRVAYLAVVGLADVEANRPMTDDTIFRIASMTKPVTSAAIMMLFEEGELALSDPVSKYVSAFLNPRVLVIDEAADGSAGPGRTVAATHEITIHELLTHTSGLTYEFWGRERLTEMYKEAKISGGLEKIKDTIGANVRRLAGLPLLHDPGSAWEYGLSTDVLGYVVEVVSGQTLDTFLSERIFRPLGMSDTHFFLPDEKRDRLAALYAPDDAQRIGRVPEGPVRVGALLYWSDFNYGGPKTYFSGGAGLVSTVHDYARFLQMLANGGTLGGRRLLEPETVALMMQNQIGDLEIYIDTHGDKFGYGFGVVTEAGEDADAASVGTCSWGGIFNTYFFVDPKTEMIGILMTQLYPNDHLTIREDFKRLAYEARQGRP